MNHNRTTIKRSKKQIRCGWRELWPVWAIGGFFLLLTVACLVHVYRVYGPQKSDVQAVSIRPDEYLRVTLAKLVLMQLHLYEVKASGGTVHFIVERTQDRIVHVALAACSVCLRSGNPNYTRKGKMICGRCNGPMPFTARGKATVAHICSLPEIPHKEINGELIVSMRDVLHRASLRQ